MRWDLGGEVKLEYGIMGEQETGREDGQLGYPVRTAAGAHRQGQLERVRNG